MNNRIFISGKVTGDDGYKAKFKATESTLAQARRICSERTERRELQSCTGCPFHDRRWVTTCRISDIFPQQLQVVNPVDLDLEGKPYWLAMLKCLWQMRKCRYVYFLRDWKDSRGAQKEHRWAVRWKKQIIYQNPDEK